MYSLHCQIKNAVLQRTFMVKDYEWFNFRRKLVIGDACYK